MVTDSRGDGQRGGLRAGIAGRVNPDGVNGISSRHQAHGRDIAERPSTAVLGAAAEQPVSVGLESGHTVRFQEKLNVGNGRQDIAAGIGVQARRG